MAESALKYTSNYLKSTGIQWDRGKQFNIQAAKRVIVGATQKVKYFLFKAESEIEFKGLLFFLFLVGLRFEFSFFNLLCGRGGNREPRTALPIGWMRRSALPSSRWLWKQILEQSCLLPSTPPEEKQWKIGRHPMETFLGSPTASLKLDWACEIL